MAEAWETNNYKERWNEPGMFAKLVSWKKTMRRPDHVGYHMEDGKDLFSASPESQTRSNSFRLQDGRFQLNTRRNFLMVKTV